MLLITSDALGSHLWKELAEGVVRATIQRLLILEGLLREKELDSVLELATTFLRKLNDCLPCTAHSFAAWLYRWFLSAHYPLTVAVPT